MGIHHELTCRGIQVRSNKNCFWVSSNSEVLQGPARPQIHIIFTQPIRQEHRIHNVTNERASWFFLRFPLKATVFHFPSYFLAILVHLFQSGQSTLLHWTPQSKILRSPHQWIFDGEYEDPLCEMLVFLLLVSDILKQIGQVGHSPAMNFLYCILTCSRLQPMLINI